MRHFYGVVLAVLLAAAVFFGAAWGFVVFNRAVENSVGVGGGRPAADGGGLPAAGGSLLPDTHVMVGGGALLAVGLAVGLLMLIPRVSPLAAGLPGLVLVAWTALFLADVREAVRLIPLQNRDFGVGFEALLFDGLLGAAGLAMIVPLFIPSRWRRRPRVPGYGTPAESPPRPDGWDEYPTVGGFTLPPGGDGNAPPDRTQTLPQQGPGIPPRGSQPPWGPVDQG